MNKDLERIKRTAAELHRLYLALVAEWEAGKILDQCQARRTMVCVRQAIRDTITEGGPGDYLYDIPDLPRMRWLLQEYSGGTVAACGFYPSGVLANSRESYERLIELATGSQVAKLNRHKRRALGQ